MTRPISQNTLQLILSDYFYKKCCLCNNNHVTLHHNLIFGGQQVDEPWAILPLCPTHHLHADRKDIREKLNWIMLNRATDEILVEYSKAVNLVSMRNYLNEKYGEYTKTTN